MCYKIGEYIDWWWWAIDKDVDETDVSDFYFRLADEGLNDYRDRAGTGLMAEDILLPTVDYDDRVGGLLVMTWISH
jgi:hypothetical protein